MLLAGMIATSVAASSALAASQCETVSSRQVRLIVEQSLAEENRTKGWEKVGGLAGSWLNRCPITDRAERRSISREVSRLLVRPNLRPQAIIILYQLGKDAAVSRSAIHSAYLDEKRRMLRIERGPEPIIGTGYEVRDGLRCLDIRLRGGTPSKRLCWYPLEFPDPEKPTSERG